MKTTSLRVRILVAVAVAVAAVLVAPPAASGRHHLGDAFDGVQTFERDVFVIVGSTLRNPDEATPADARLYNVAGVGLDLTWGQWQAASATATMRAHGRWTDASLTFTGLVPGGVYSVFYGTLTPDSENPLCPGVERALPLTSTDRHQSPDAASFVAGADGTASFTARVSEDPLAAVQAFVELVYHFDGMTYGSLPNRGEHLTQPECRSSFGEDAMRQLFLIWQQG